MRENKMIEEMKPHQKRVVDEKTALDEKLNKLKEFLVSDIFDGLTMQEQELLKIQSSYMQSYSDILAERIHYFNRYACDLIK
jgi:hypothetical protein